MPGMKLGEAIAEDAREVLPYAMGVGIIAGGIRLAAGERLEFTPIEWAAGGFTAIYVFAFLVAILRAWQFRKE